MKTIDKAKAYLEHKSQRVFKEGNQLYIVLIDEDNNELAVELSKSEIEFRAECYQEDILDTKVNCYEVI